MKITEKGKFKVKGFVTTGDDDEEARIILGGTGAGRVLGIPWHPSTDEFSVQVKIIVVSRKQRRVARQEEQLSVEEIPQLITVVLTRRILLGIMNSCYDLFGFICPITVQLKIEMRVLLKPELNLGWDDPIPLDLKERWIRILQLLKGAEGVRFKRCIKPKNAIGLPVLIVCNDGSDDAMCATAHMRWEIDGGEYVCSLLAAKTRVTPLSKETTPRIEF